MMGDFSRLVQNRKKRIFVCAVSLVLFCGTWINIQGQPPIDNVNPGKQELLETPFLIHREVSENDKRLWQKQFFAGVDKILGQFVHNQSLPTDNPYDIKHPVVRDPMQAAILKSNAEKDLETRLPMQSMIKVASHNGLFEFLEPASCKPILPEMVLYNRIFKTGSETIGTLFQFVATVMNYDYAKRTTEDFYDEGISAPYPMIIERAARAIGNRIFYNAHVYFRDNLKIQRTHTYMNQIREPVARYISDYAYMHNARHRPAWRIRKMIQNGEWNETLEQCFEKEGQGCRRNLMTRFFCGPERFCKKDSRRALEKAKQNILKHYVVVGLLEHFHLTLKILQKRLPYFFPVVPKDSDFKVNQAVEPQKSNSVSREMIAKIKQANWADIELYEFVKQLFWKQVKACGIS